MSVINVLKQLEKYASAVATIASVVVIAVEFVQKPTKMLRK